MQGTFTIAWKDFRILATSPLFMLIISGCCLIWSYNFLRDVIIFSRNNMQAFQSMNIYYNVFYKHISFSSILFIFIIPAITMRLLSEEKKMRTYDLLLTVPVTATDIALGKFLAGFGAAILLILASAIYPLGTAFFAEFHFGPLVTSYLGLALVTGAYVAVGLFSSSITESVVLSVIMGIIFNLALWFVGGGMDFSDAPTFTAIMSHLNLGQHFYNFAKGTVQISSLVFFLSLIGLFVFLSQRVIESSRWR